MSSDVYVISCLLTTLLSFFSLSHIFIATYPIFLLALCFFPFCLLTIVLILVFISTYWHCMLASVLATSMCYKLSFFYSVFNNAYLNSRISWPLPFVVLVKAFG